MTPVRAAPKAIIRHAVSAPIESPNTGPYSARREVFADMEWAKSARSAAVPYSFLRDRAVETTATDSA